MINEQGGSYSGFSLRVERQEDDNAVPFCPDNKAVAEEIRQK